MKKILILILVLVLVLGGGGAYYLSSQKEKLVTEKLVTGLKNLTGTASQMEGLSVTSVRGFSEWKATLKKLVIQNPENFQGSEMALIKEVEILFEPLPLLQGKWKIHKLSALLSRAHFQTNGEGVLNAAQLPGIKALMVPNAEGKTSTSSGNFQADLIELKYGKLYHIDGQQNPAKKTAYPLKGKVDIYRNVQHPDLLVQVPVFTYLSYMNQGSFGLPRGKLQESIKQSISQ